MNAGRFDERCPHCAKRVMGLNGVFESHDYQTDFQFSCPECGKEIQCDVHSNPEFELSKAQTPEEYAAMVKKMKEAVS